MSSINRRNWLKASGLLGATTLLPGWAAANQLSYPDPLASSNSKLIRLNSNENPYGPSKRVREAVKEAFSEACRYPGFYLDELRDAIAKKEGVSKDHLVITGGSTEGLKVVGSAYGMYGGEIIAGKPTFLSMMRHADHFGATTNWVDVKEDMTLDLDEMYKRIGPKTQMIFLCNPNNPTSTLADRQKLEDFVVKSSEKTMVFSDEAYYDFIEESNYPSMLKYVKEGRNVIVSRTFSKVYGIAGMRIGYMIARPDIAQYLKARVVAFTNVLAIKAAIEALKDDEFYAHSLKKNKECKDMIYQTLDKLDRKYVQSHTNFVFFHSGMNISDLQKKFMAENIEIGRPFPPFTDWCRISTGTVEEVDQFCKVLKKVYS